LRLGIWKLVRLDKHRKGTYGRLLSCKKYLYKNVQLFVFNIIFFPIKTKSNSFENFLKLNFAFFLACLPVGIYILSQVQVFSIYVYKSRFLQDVDIILIDSIYISLGGALLVSWSNIKMINVIRWSYNNTKIFLLFCYAIELVGTTEK